jgi:hypothetical protein
VQIEGGDVRAADRLAQLEEGNEGELTIGQGRSIETPDDRGERVKVLYGEANGSLVFVTEKKLRWMIELDEARWASDTWSGYAAALRALKKKGNHDDVEDVDPDLFDEDDLYPVYRDGRHADGDWPEPWLLQQHLDWLPDEVQELGSIGVSMVSGEGLWLDPELEDRILEEMARHGYDCVRDKRINTDGYH